jgi:hypothetical protein
MSDSAKCRNSYLNVSPEIDILTQFIVVPTGQQFTMPQQVSTYTNGRMDNQRRVLLYLCRRFILSYRYKCSGPSDVDSLLVIDYPDNGFDWPSDSTLCTNQTIHLELGYPYLTYEWWVGSDHTIAESVDVFMMVVSRQS